MPIIAGGTMLAMKQIGFLCPPEADPALWAILFIKAITPTANNVILIATLQGNDDAARELAKTLLMEYMFGIFTMAAWLAIFLHSTGIGS